MIDTHCHLTSKGLFERVDEVIQQASAAGVDRMISVATRDTDARQAIDLASQHEGIFATLGIHPHEAQAWQDPHQIAAMFTELSTRPGVVAFGEMGLDWFYNDPEPDVQRRCFELQLQWICDHATRDAGTDLPIVIHNRQATDHTLAMINASGLPGERFVFHCFTGTREELEQILNLGAWISFTGIVTFKNSKDLAEASDLVPIDRLMVETDSPYLTPEPHRKVRPNEPKFVKDVAAFLAARRNMPPADFIAQMDRNARTFFRLG